LQAKNPNVSAPPAQMLNLTKPKAKTQNVIYQSGQAAHERAWCLVFA
jgi:hypothetical protein